MQLTHYLTPQSVIVPLKGESKEAVFVELVEELARREGLKGSQQLVHAIQEREQSASTFLPMGIAVPHARVPLVKEMVMVTGVSPRGIQDDPTQSPLTAHIFCLFFSPTEEKEFGKHLKLLARIAAVFSAPELVTEIAALTSASEIFTRIQKRERQIDRG